MKRSSKPFAAAAAAASATLVLVWPTVALADAYTDDYASRGVLAGFCGVYACLGVFGLLALVFWVWMLVDLIARQEHEFPGSTGNSKTMWLLIMLLTLPTGCSWIAAIVYYFVVYQKIKRGTVPPPCD